MSLLSILVVIAPAIVVVLVVVLVAHPRRRRPVTFNVDDFPRLGRLRRVTTRARVIALVVGLIVVVAMTGLGPLGMGLMLAPAVFAATQILATLAADVLTHSSARTPGTSGLEVRRIGAYLPRALTLATAVALLVLAGTLAWTTAVGSVDDMGRAGRAFTYSYPCDGVCRGSFTPWPGSYYSIPLGVALVVLVALAVVAVTMTVRRPRDASDREIVRVDDFIRKRSTESVVAALGLGCAASLTAVCVLASRLVPSTVPGVSNLLVAAGWAAVVVGILALGMSVWCFVVLLLPGAGAHVPQADRGPTARTVVPR